MRQIATTVPNWYTMDTCRRNQHWRLCCLFGISQKKSSRHNTIIFQFNQGFHCEVPSSHTYISNILLLCIYSPIQKGNPKFWQHYLKQDQKKLFFFCSNNCAWFNCMLRTYKRIVLVKSVCISCSISKPFKSVTKSLCCWFFFLHLSLAVGKTVDSHYTLYHQFSLYQNSIVFCYVSNLFYFIIFCIFLQKIYFHFFLLHFSFRSQKMLSSLSPLCYCFTLITNCKDSHTIFFFRLLHMSKLSHILYTFGLVQWTICALS